MRSLQKLSRLATVALLLTITLLLAGCSGGNQPDTLSDGTGVTETTTDTALPYLPTDAYVDPEVILNRRGAEIYTRELPASDYFVKSPRAEVDVEAGTLTFGTTPCISGSGLFASLQTCWTRITCYTWKPPLTPRPCRMNSGSVSAIASIYFASCYSPLYCLGPDTELLWRYDTGTRQIFSPVIADSGIVYFLARLYDLYDGYYLLAFGPAE